LDPGLLPYWFGLCPTKALGNPPKTVNGSERKCRSLRVRVRWRYPGPSGAVPTETTARQRTAFGAGPFEPPIAPVVACRRA
jgi:hypothetical protein